MIKVDQTAASQLQLTQMDVMRNLVASLNSSVQFNKRNFWIDPVKHNQYYVGVQYPPDDIKSLETLKDIQITSAPHKKNRCRQCASRRAPSNGGPRRGHPHRLAADH